MAKRVARRGRWTYGNHTGLNPGWRLDGTNLVLDFDPLSQAAGVRGCWTLWINGVEQEPIDHYLDGAMEFIESLEQEYVSA